MTQTTNQPQNKFAALDQKVTDAQKTEAQQSQGPVQAKDGAKIVQPDAGTPAPAQQGSAPVAQS